MSPSLAHIFLALANLVNYWHKTRQHEWRIRIQFRLRGILSIHKLAWVGSLQRQPLEADASLVGGNGSKVTQRHPVAAMQLGKFCSTK